MISLFLNTSSSYLGLALFKDKNLIDSYYEKLDKDVSRIALVKVKEIIENNGYTKEDIDSIYCVNGPGSFTGLRVGVTISKTFAFFKEKNLFAVSSLYSLAASIKGYDYIVPVIDARRGFVFAGIYDKDYNSILEDEYISLDELKEKTKTLKNVIFVSEVPINGLETTLVVPSFENIIRNYHEKKVEASTFTPTYLKKTEAEENLNK